MLRNGDKNLTTLINMERVTFKTIYARIKAETPIFWKKIRRLGVGIGAVGGAAKLAIETHSMDLEWMKADYYNSMILIGSIAAVLASMTVEPKKDENI